jgi:hypothetical protein
MGHEASVISGSRMNDFGEYAQTAPLPLWVVGRLSSEFEALGLYGRIASAAAMEDPEKMRVTISRDWAQALFSEGGDFEKPMKLLMDIEAITEVAKYRSGKIRLQMEAYPPEIKEELEQHRRPNGKLVAAFS